MRSWQAIFCTAFALLLMLPGLQMLTGAIKVAPLEENRVLAAFPALPALAQPEAYVAALRTWFADHYGFRPLLVRAKSQVDYSLFGASDRLHIGPGGFLFYRSVIDQSEPTIERFSDADLDRAAGFFARLRDWLAPRGVRLVVVTAQLKDRFYPEELPREARFAALRHRFDDFRARLAAVPGITYVDTTPTLEALKRERPIFHKTDFHWNDPAAFAMGARLVDQLARLEGRPVQLWTHKLRVVQRPLSGGQAMFMPLFWPPQETALFVDPTWDAASINWDASVPPFEWRASAAHRAPDDLLPGTIVFGDSFVGGMVRSGLPLYFSNLHYARLYGVPLATVLEHIPPGTKYLVVEFIEVSLPSFLDMALPE